MRNYFGAFLAVLLAGQTAHATSASYYADKFNGRKTASGETFSNQGLTCASNDYALGTHLEVTNTKNGKTVICKVNDRMAKSGYVDLTKKAFSQIAPLAAGRVKVQVQKANQPTKAEQSISLAYNEQ